MSPGRILVVDTETEILGLLVRRLTRRGYQVTTAGSGREALIQLQEIAYDAAILDSMMLGENGSELARHCRERHPSLKILILTGSPVMAETEAAPYPFLRKPLDDMTLLDAAIERLLADCQRGPANGGRR